MKLILLVQCNYSKESCRIMKNQDKWVNIICGTVLSVLLCFGGVAVYNSFTGNPTNRTMHAEIIAVSSGDLTLTAKNENGTHVFVLCDPIYKYSDTSDRRQENVTTIAKNYQSFMNKGKFYIVYNAKTNTVKRIDKSGNFVVNFVQRYWLLMLIGTPFALVLLCVAFSALKNKKETEHVK